MDAREMLDRAAEAQRLADVAAEQEAPAAAARYREDARTWALMANADAQLRVASAIAHVTHRGAILTQQRG